MITKDHKGTKECCFYSGEYHLEMILLPYICQNIDKIDFVILTENDLEKSVRKVLKNINIEKEKKEKIYKLNWHNNYLEKLIKIKKYINNDKVLTVFINGDKKFNAFIKKQINLYNDIINIVDCFDIEIINKNEINGILKKYDNIINTKSL